MPVMFGRLKSILFGTAGAPGVGGGLGATVTRPNPSSAALGASVPLDSSIASRSESAPLAWSIASVVVLTWIVNDISDRDSNGSRESQRRARRRGRREGRGFTRD